MSKITVGSVVQVSNKFPNPDFTGLLVIVTEITGNVIQGYFQVINSEGDLALAYIKLHPEEVIFIGQAKLVLVEEEQ